MNRLKDKVAVVTGASKGIGAAIARAFAAEGARVAVNYLSSGQAADRLVEEIEKAGGRAKAIQADMGKSQDIVRLFAEAEAALGKPGILVNNAGLYGIRHLNELREEDYRREFDVTVWGAVQAAQEASRHFGPAGGSIINISSIASGKAIPGSLVTAAAKAALDAVTRVLAAELSPRKIRVNSIAPGMVETEGLHSKGLLHGDLRRQMESATPLGRIGQPEDIAKVAVFLASDEAGWVTGERIAAAGGFT